MRSLALSGESVNTEIQNKRGCAVTDGFVKPPNPNMLSWNKGHTGTFSLLSSFIIHSETLFTQFLWRNMTYSFLLLFMLLSSTLWIVLNSIILPVCQSLQLFSFPIYTNYEMRKTPVNVICTVNRDFSSSLFMLLCFLSFKDHRKTAQTIYDLFFKGNVFLLSLKLDGK